MARPTAKQELEAVAAFLVNAIMDKVELERQLRFQEHRIIMLDAERHRLFDQLAEEERKEVESLMAEATEKGLGQARWLIVGPEFDKYMASHGSASRSSRLSRRAARRTQ